MLSAFPSAKSLLFSNYLTISCRALAGLERLLWAFWGVRSAWLFPTVLLLISFLTSFPSMEMDFLVGELLFPPSLIMFLYPEEMKLSVFHCLFNIVFIGLVSSGGFTLMKMQCPSTSAIILSATWAKQPLWWLELDSLSTKTTSNGMYSCFFSLYLSFFWVIET